MPGEGPGFLLALTFVLLRVLSSQLKCPSLHPHNSWILGMKLGEEWWGRETESRIIQVPHGTGLPWARAGYQLASSSCSSGPRNSGGALAVQMGVCGHAPREEPKILSISGYQGYSSLNPDHNV